MRISREPAESRQAIGAVLQNPVVEPLVHKWAQSFHTAQRIFSVFLELNDLICADDPNEAVTSLLDEGEMVISRATTLARGGARSDELELAKNIRDVLDHERTGLKPDGLGWVQNHLTRLALINTLFSMKPTNTTMELTRPIDIEAQLRNDAGRTHAGLELMHQSLRGSSGDMMVVHFTGYRARAIAGAPTSFGISGLSQIAKNITVNMAPSSGQIAASFNTLDKPVFSPRVIQQRGLAIPIADLAPVVRISADELMSEGLFGFGDFETYQDRARTVIVTEYYEKELKYRDDMSPLRGVVAAMGRVAQKHQGLID